MKNNHDSQHAVRRIVLPSGRTIEVIRYDDPVEPARELHVCRACLSRLVQVAQWSHTAEGTYDMTLECPNCGWVEQGNFSREQVEALEDRLDAGLAELIADLQRLSRANMADDIERLIEALNDELILPEDF